MTLDLRYIAGFFDGEGCFSIGRHNHGIVARVMVTNTDKRPLLALQKQYGGRISELTLRKKNWKQGFQWTLPNSPAVEFMCAIEPWLIIKKRHALLAMTYDAARPGNLNQQSSHNQWDEDSRDLILAESRWLNHRGPREPKDKTSPMTKVALRAIRSGPPKKRKKPFVSRAEKRKQKRLLRDTNLT